MERNDEIMWVALAADQAVGFASLRADEVMALYAASNAPRGTGTALLKTVMAEALRTGETVLFATASLNAVSFYARHGFRELGPAELIRAGVVIPAMRMGRSVAD